MYQWPPFSFFDQQLVKEEGSDAPHPLFKELNIVCCASGRGSIIVGDIEGFINIVDRDFKARAFQAYDKTIKHVQQLKSQNILITVGSDEHPIESILRVWNLDKQDKTGNPLCMKTINLNVKKPITKMVGTEDLSHIAVGTMDGTVLLVHGDIVRERSPKQIEIRTMDGIPVTGLGWNEGWLGGNALYVVTSAAIQCYHFFSNMRVEELDDHGAELGCAQLSEQSNMIAARENAIYFFAPDVRRDCLAFSGRKKMIGWFRSHLIVVWAEDTSGQNFNTVNIYDLRNRFTAFTDRFHNVTHVVNEWGSIFILTADGKAYQLVEKDTQTKLDTLFRNDLYSVAINLAKSQQGYDTDAIVDIYRKYGDYLYGSLRRLDFDGAMAQYLQTLDGLEPSYVIRKFLDAQRIHNLTTYLQALHTKNIANPDHTTLLLNCYTKLKDEQQINAFIEKSAYQFDVDTAVNVCRQAGYHEQALRLAKRHQLHDVVLKILLEDLHRHLHALEYIRTLDFEEAEANMKLHGKELMTHLPAQSTELLKQLCTTYQPTGGQEVESLGISHTPGADEGNTPGASDDVADLASLLDVSSFIVNANRSSSRMANPADFVHIFVKQPDWLVMVRHHCAARSDAVEQVLTMPQFLEFIIDQEEFIEMQAENESAAVVIYDTLLEMYLREDREQKKKEQQQKAMALLNNRRAVFDDNHALVLAKMHGFHEGAVLLYERQHMFNEKLQYFMELEKYDEILKTCKRHGEIEPNLWIQALSYFASRKDEKCEYEIKEVLKFIERNRLLPPLLVIQILAQNTGTTLSVVKDYIIETLKQSHHLIREDKRQIREISEETEKMRSEIEELKTSAKIFQVSKCSACLNQLDIHSTSVHFLCMHSFHLRCLGENERECPICLPENKKILDIRRHLEENADEHDQFFKQLTDSQLDCAMDGFSKVAEYFGRGIFHSILPPGQGGSAGGRGGPSSST